MDDNNEKDKPGADARSALEAGEFSLARELYTKRLNQSPDNIDYQAGLFAAGFWDNRYETIKNIPSGRELASYYISEWDQFEKVIEDKGFKSEVLRSAMKAIMARAAEQYRIIFQKEGISSMDPASLEDLANCLIRIEDYQNAVEILRYARKMQPYRASLLFKLGDALCLAEDQNSFEQGLGAFRDGFLIQPAEFKMDAALSYPVTELLTELKDRFSANRDKMLMWIPARLMISSMYPGLRRLQDQELKQLTMETARLEKEMQRVQERYREKVQTRLLFYYAVLLCHYRFHEFNQEAIEDLENAINEVDPILHDIYVREKK